MPHDGFCKLDDPFGRDRGAVLECHDVLVCGADEHRERVALLLGAGHLVEGQQGGGVEGAIPPELHAQALGGGRREAATEDSK